MRMRRTILGAVALLAAIPASSFAGGPPPCGPTCGPTYTTQWVTGYRCVTRTVQVDTVTYQTVPREEKYESYECVPVTKPYTYNVTTYKMVPKEVPYTYYECVPVTKPYTYNQTTYRAVPKEVPYNYYDTEYETVNQKQTAYRCVTVPRVYETVTPVCQMVPVCTPIQGCCGQACGYNTCYQPVTSYQKSYCTTYENVAQPYETMVPVTICKQVKKAGTYTAYESVPETKPVTVNVTSYERQEKHGTYTAYECVPETRPVTVNVTSYEYVRKPATRTVYQCVAVPTKVPYTYCENVPYQYPVQVPCYPPACGSCGPYGH